jgi:elongation factor Ts
MPVISSGDVNKLRQQTGAGGAGMMDCKKALEAAGGDFDKAVKVLREQGQATAAKRAGRATAEGLVTFRQAGAQTVLVELDCETDFVAKTDDFQKLLSGFADKAIASKWNSAADADTSHVKEIIAKLGENIALKRLARFEGGASSVFGVYIHPSGSTGKVGVIVEVDAPKSASSDDVKALAKDLAMQTAATSPKWVRREDVPSETVESEKAIARALAQKEGKPEKIWDKIAEGKINQFSQMFCLLEQPFVKDPGGKTLVKQLVEQVSKKAGDAVTVKRFARFKVGEE